SSSRPTRPRTRSPERDRPRPWLLLRMTCRMGDADAVPRKAPTAKAAVFAQAVNDRNEGKRVRFQAREKDRFHRDTSILSRDNGAVPDETPARAVPRAFYMA